MKTHQIGAVPSGVKWLALGLLMLLTACSGIDNSRVPVGTWENVAQQRYITIETDAKHYRAILFSVIETSSSNNTSGAANKSVLHERTLPAVMKAGVLTIQADKDVEFTVLYHPSDELIVVNGVTEFRRMPDSLAQLTLAELTSASR